jgi:hypothetical protein
MRPFGRFAIGAEDINRGNDRILYISNEFGDWAGEYRSICRGQRSVIYFGKSFKACRALCLLKSAVESSLLAIQSHEAWRRAVRSW